MKINSDSQLKCYRFIDQPIDMFSSIFDLVVKRLKQRIQSLKFKTLLWITNHDLLIQTLTNKTNLNSINIEYRTIFVHWTTLVIFNTILQKFFDWTLKLN